MELAAGEQGHQPGVDLPALVSAEEEPFFSTQGLAAQRVLAPVVVNRQPAVAELGRSAANALILNNKIKESSIKNPLKFFM